MKKVLGATLIVVAALGTVALAIPTPTAGACLHCVVPRCPPCTRLGGGSCFQCPSCQPIPGCKA